MYIVSCFNKLYAFNLAEQLSRHQQLHTLFTAYAYQKDVFWRRFASRVDKEVIPVDQIRTIPVLAVGRRLYDDPPMWNDRFDRWVGKQLKTRSDFEIFIGWSGMSLHSIRSAKELGKLTIVERASAHIITQGELLKKEFAKFQVPFQIDKRVVLKELKEYEEADFISIPSSFVKRTFLEQGVPAEKLIINPYGTSFRLPDHKIDKPKVSERLRIVYLGTLSIRKGIPYLFEALDRLEKKNVPIDAWFIGKVEPKIQELLNKYGKKSWKFWGHINHYELPKYLSQCDVGIVPSVEDGFAMVTPQLLACGLPVIISANTGSADLIIRGRNGFVIPPCSAGNIVECLANLAADSNLLENLKQQVKHPLKFGITWQDYGNRYLELTKKLVPN